MQLRPQYLGRGQNGQIFGHMDAGSIEFQQFDLFGIFAGTENDAEWQVFFEFPLVLRQPAEVELHLAFVFGLEVALLQLHDHQALKFAVVEQQVDALCGIWPNCKSFLLVPRQPASRVSHRADGCILKTSGRTIDRLLQTATIKAAMSHMLTFHLYSCRLATG